MRLEAVEFSIPLLATAVEGQRNGEYWRVQNPLPEDAEFVYCFMTESQRSVVFVFTHPTFADVLLGQKIPRRELCYESKII